MTSLKRPSPSGDVRFLVLSSGPYFYASYLENQYVVPAPSRKSILTYHKLPCVRPWQRDRAETLLSSADLPDRLYVTGRTGYPRPRHARHLFCSIVSSRPESFQFRALNEARMEFLIDTLAAVFVGVSPWSAAGITGLFVILSSYILTGSWVVLGVALAGRVCNALLLHLGRFSVQRRAKSRRQTLMAQVRREQEDFDIQAKSSPKPEDEGWERVEGYAVGSAENGKASSSDAEWSGIIGFLHPFCNAGGGGERVLWAAIKATQERYPKAICVIYTGDHDSNKTTILQRVAKRFDIHLYPPTVHFFYLNTRDYVVASQWPRFTLLGQALGSIIMAWDALSLITPDILLDTMGYAFSTAFIKYFFPEIPTGAYVHYPFIGTHMVDSLTSDAGQGVNAGAGKGAKGLGKRLYWSFLVSLYILAGRSLDTVMTNSSWTKAHMSHIWASNRRQEHKSKIEVVFPPVAVEEIIEAIPLEGPDVKAREKKLVYIAQFRPEKNHELILQSFAKMIRSGDQSTRDAQLVLIGSVRDSEDETLVYKLRLLARELMIEAKVDFRTKDVSWAEILDSLRSCWVGVNGMWCEHFGIGVVEYQAAGLISVVNDSGGPKQDIVVDFGGTPTGRGPSNKICGIIQKAEHILCTGYHATTIDDYSTNFTKALSLNSEAENDIRHNARSSSKRFSTANFASGWIHSLQQLIDMQSSRSKSPLFNK